MKTQQPSLFNQKQSGFFNKNIPTDSKKAKKLEEQEKAKWTICSDIECNFTDSTGGATCPICGSETKKFVVK